MTALSDFDFRTLTEYSPPALGWKGTLARAVPRPSASTLMGG